MAEEEVMVEATTTSGPVPSDHHKRKLEDFEPEEVGSDPKPEAESDSVQKPPADEEDVDGSEAKRPRLEDNKANGLAAQNGYEEKIEEEPKEDDNVQPSEAEKNDTHPEVSQEVATEAAESVREQPADTDQKTGDVEHSDAEKISEAEKSSQVDEPSKGDIQELDVEKSTQVDEPSKGEGDIGEPDAEKSTQVDEPSKGDIQEPSAEAPETEGVQLDQEHPASDDQTFTRKMEVPNNKVGVLIGKSGDTIRYLQYNSGAKIQIMRDADTDPHAATRPVELIGTLENINKAEKLIKDVIAEADAGGSPALVARGFGTVQAVVGEQIEIQVPNEKVGLIIGKGGETIKSLQTRSGARIQLVPLPSDGKESKERTVRVTGDKKQIDMAREMIKEVMSQPVRPSTQSSGYGQQAFRPRGGAAPPQWGPRGGHPGQFPGYDYHQRGQYSSRSPQYPPPAYGNYPPQQAPRGGFGQGWEQRPPASMQGPQSQANYSYGQAHGPDYGQSYPHHQAQHGQGYGHGYTDVKYDHQMAPQNQYGGHGPSQPTSYPQSAAHPSYGTHEQYGKPPSYGMHPQASHSQPYSHPRANQPGEVPYQQGPAPSTQGYGASMPQQQQQQQQYPYASSGQMQQTYPAYGSTVTADGYNHPQAAPASGPGYPQQVSSAASGTGYGQPVPQQPPAYAQAAPAGGYSSYPSQPAYTEQQATGSAGYYQAPVDQTYSGAQASTTYSAPYTGQQAYAQPATVPAAAPAQPGYDQSMAQSGGYATVPAAAGYVKSVSPQPGYAQYDANQMYGAPR
ncbi:uncharacterized protein [Nicotiana sylvestris]|uniref:Far upstream element-binding protein 1-like isoform X1 n=1 Tax=Nicotiana sylvestris TaxID=4096 RepID=A0A1U7YNH1_NICSY|nr:PREDICTED: far upstream element-binding protein 1-like isoform X1 [Nicotiana sylvestris]